MDYKQIIYINTGVKLLRQLTEQNFAVVYDTTEEMWALSILLDNNENGEISIIPITMSKGLEIMAQFMQMIMNVFVISKGQFPDEAILKLSDYEYLLTGAEEDEMHDKNKCS